MEHLPPQSAPSEFPHSPRLLLPPDLLADLIAHAHAEAPRECCGLLGGSFVPAGWQARTVYRLVNEAPGNRAFRVLEGLLHPFKLMRTAGEDLVAIYHSHPDSPARPSAADLAQNYYPRTPHLILSLADAQPHWAAFLLHRQSFTTVEVVDR